MFWNQKPAKKTVPYYDGQKKAKNISSGTKASETLPPPFIRLLEYRRGLREAIKQIVLMRTAPDGAIKFALGEEVPEASLIVLRNALIILEQSLQGKHDAP